MKRKVMIISETTSGGVRKHILDLLLNLDIEKYELYFAYSLKRADETMMMNISKLKNRGIHLIELKYMNREINLIQEMKALNELNKIIRQISPDIVHCHSSKAGAIGRISAKVSGIKKIYYTPHAYIMQNPSINKIKKIIFTNIERVLSRHCTTKTINVSNGEKNFAEKLNIDKNIKFQVIYNGVDEEITHGNIVQLKKELDIEEEDIVVGVAARMDDQKDPFTFIKIAEKVSSKNENIKFIYIGDGEYKNKIETYIAENSLEKNIKLLGFRNDTEQLLQIMDIYLVTSLYESMPYSLIEALKYGLPIVATNTIGNNEIVIERNNGLMFNIKDVDEGASKIKEIIKDKEKIHFMSKNSYKLFKCKFLLDNMINKVEALYDLES